MNQKEYVDGISYEDKLVAMRTILFGVPRSGTSWVGAMLASHPDVAYRFQPIHSYTFDARLDSTSSKSEIEEFFEALARTKDPYVRNISHSKTDELVAEEFSPLDAHLVLKEVHDLESIENCIITDSSARLLGIVRDPVEVLRSWINMPREWDKNWKIEEEWWNAKKKNSEYAGNHFGVSQWILTTQKLQDLQRVNKDRVRIVRYESLIHNLDDNIAQILDFLGLPKSTDIEAFARKTQLGESSDGYSVFRGKSYGSGPMEVPDSIVSSTRIAVKKAGLEEFMF